MVLLTDTSCRWCEGHRTNSANYQQPASFLLSIGIFRASLHGGATTGRGEKPSFEQRALVAGDTEIVAE
ncbi:hypothetical protein L596_029280 [Steinernema carpocapsae]|uniref:Uncharacterized protein n=1 Tax=Steinernema carpocapsae TaxID=34508 RepID=A0A4U5LU63_STECR|nr:hypothetical protein L596_029280 [Steinernema carpocapsae]